MDTTIGVMMLFVLFGFARLAEMVDEYRSK